MLFEEAEWLDGDKGQSLANSLFQKRLEETVEKVTNKKRSRKRKKVPNEGVVFAKTGAVLDKCSPHKPSKKYGKGDGGDAALDKPKCENDTISQTNSSLKSSWKKNRLEKLMLKSSKSAEKTTERNSCVDRACDSNKNSSKSVKEEKSMSAELHTAVSSRLQSAQFRFLNEQLYTRDSRGAEKLFAADPQSFFAYHSGFLQQISKWPTNPLDLIITFLKKRPQHWIVGDFGCGDARLAACVKNKVHSFDLMAVNERVTVADISDVPLPDSSLNVAVFCLSLMGTNYVDFLLEANRTLMDKGLLLVAEVTSRFRSVPKFVVLMKNLGFELKRQDRRNSHFLLFDFVKVKPPQTDFQKPLDLLKPCVYKKR